MLELLQQKRLIEHMGGRWWLPQQPLPESPFGLSWQDVIFDVLEKESTPPLKLKEITAKEITAKEISAKKETLPLNEGLAFSSSPSKESAKPKELANLKEVVKRTDPAVQRHVVPANKVAGHAVSSPEVARSERITLHLYLHRVGRILFVLEHDQWEVAQLAQKESALLSDMKQTMRLLLKADSFFFEDTTEQVMHFDWPRVTHAKIPMTQQDAFSAVDGLIHSITHKEDIRLLLFFGKNSASYVHPLHQRVADFEIYTSSESIPMVFLPPLLTLFNAVALKKELWTCLKKLVMTL
jgi:hypothetical protein